MKKTNPLVLAKALVATAFSVLLTIESSAQTNENVHSGNASLILHNARANYHIGLTLTANTTYTLSYWVKALDAGTRIGVTLATDVPGVYPPLLTNQNSAVTAGGYQTYTSEDDQWHQYFATITPAETSDLYTIGIDIRPSPAYIDDVVLRATGSTTNLIHDAGFETSYQSHYNGDGLGWPTANWVNLRWYSEYAWDTHQYGNPGGPKALTIEGTPAIVHSGNGSLRVTNGVNRANYTGLSLTAGTNYTLKYWVKTETNSPIGVTLSTAVPGSGTFTERNSAVTSGGYASYNAPDGNWSQYTATITPAITTNIFAIGIDVRPVTGDFYIDDVELVAEGSSSNLVEDPGFETAYQSHFNGDGSGWPTANWVNLRWTSEYAWAVHQFGNPNGPKALYIEAAPPADTSWPAPTVLSAVRSVLNPNQVSVTFSATGVQAASATNPLNYSLNNGNSVTGGSINSTLTTVTLTLANNIDNSLTHTLTINGVLGADGSPILPNTAVNILVPTSEAARAQSSGVDQLLVLEAEHNNLNVSPGGGRSWLFTTTPPTLQPTDANLTYSGTGVMIADPDTGLNVGSPPIGSIPSGTPRLDFKVNFVAAGTYAVWARGIGDSAPGAGANDSVLIGLDGLLSTRLTGFPGGQGYSWGNTPVGGGSNTITVASPGLHVVNVWMREDGFAFDKLLLSSNPGFNPTGIGPAESPVLVVGPTLAITRSGGNLILSWSGGGILQSSTNVAGPYGDILGSSSPWNVAPTGDQNFYRVKQ